MCWTWQYAHPFHFHFSLSYFFILALWCVGSVWVFCVATLHPHTIVSFVFFFRFKSHVKAQRMPHPLFFILFLQSNVRCVCVCVCVCVCMCVRSVCVLCGNHHTPFLSQISFIFFLILILIFNFNLFFFSNLCHRHPLSLQSSLRGILFFLFKVFFWVINLNCLFQMVRLRCNPHFRNWSQR